MKGDFNIEYFTTLAKQYYKESEARAAEFPTSNKILVVIVEPNKRPYRKCIYNNLVTFRDVVGGYIENILLDETNKKQIGLIVNEEGKLLNMPFNKRLFGRNGMFDIIVGTIIITAYNLNGENISLSNNEANRYIKLFTPVEVHC
jgi:hypothetical protein